MYQANGDAHTGAAFGGFQGEQLLKQIPPNRGKFKLSVYAGSRRKLTSNTASNSPFHQEKLGGK